MDGIFGNILKNNIDIIGNIKEEQEEEVNAQSLEVDESEKRKNHNKIVVLDWLTMSFKENEKFRELEEENEDEAGDEDEAQSLEEEDEAEAQSLEDEDEDEAEDEAQSLEDEDEDEDEDEEETEGIFQREKRFDTMSKFYCYRIMIEFVKELKNQEDKVYIKNKINANGLLENEEYEVQEYVYRQYQFDEPTEEESFKYKMHNNQIAIKTKLDNEFYLSLLFYCFEVVYDNKPLVFNELRQKIIDSSIEDYDMKIMRRIKYMTSLDINNWFSFIEDSMAIPFGDYVQYEFNFDKTMIIEKTKYNFDEMITHQDISDTKIYTIDDILQLYENKILESRVLSKYH